jgi:hypothetical protein
MAKTITQLPDATTVGAADEMIIQQSGVTKRATIDELKTQVAALGARDVTVSAANRSITNTGNFALSFGTNNTERMRIDASGNAGIGTASPARKFHTAVVAAPAAAQSSKVGLLIQNGDGTGTSGSPNSAIIQFAYDPASPRAYIEAGTLGNDFLAFGYETTERMRIDGSGNVGIGVSPATKFHLQDADHITLRVSTTDATKTASLEARSGSGSCNVSQSGTSSFFTNFSSAGSLLLTQSGNGPITFNTDGSERMRVSGTGSVSIGTDSANAAALLDVSSTTKGFLPPRMTTAQRDAISTPPAGLVLYNTSTNKLQVRTNTAWADLH